MAAKPKSGPMCIVTIGYQHLLMPATEGMKVVALLANAIDVDYDRENLRRVGYVVNEPAQVRFETVTADQIRARPDPESSAANRVLQLEGPRR